MKISKLFVCGLVLLVTSCGGGGGGDGNNGNDSVSSFAGARSQLCGDISGLEAVFWDFINGVPRGDLPSTAFTIPFDLNPTQNPYQNSVSLLLGYTVPRGWDASDAFDVSGFAVPFTFVGSDLVRADNRAVWRYILSSQISGGFTADSILTSEINAALGFFGNPASATSECNIDVQQIGILGPVSTAAKIIRAGDVTIMARVQVIIVSGVSAFYSGIVVVGFDNEFEQNIFDIHVPMITQLYGGGTDPEACEDGVDNDGDGNTDFPADTECSSPSDDNESS